MKIFSAQQIKACDAYTIQAEPIRSVDLMERAALQCFNWIKGNYPGNSLFVILCGTGNNGGDGLAIARMLHYAGYQVKAFLLKVSEQLSPDCEANLERLQRIDNELVTFIDQDRYITELHPDIIIIDAIFGTGLNRPLAGWVATFVDHLNQLPNRKIAIDLPTGLNADYLPAINTSILKAAHTLSFQFFKRSFLHPESYPFTGPVRILDISLNKQFINATQTQYRTIDRADILSIYQPRLPFSHKGDYGKALIVGGSYGKIGAAVLCTKACLKSGAGLVTALLPSVGYTVMQSAVPEAMCQTSGTSCIEKIENWEQYDIIGIGPGLGVDPDTIAAFEEFIDQCKQPLIVDADAINILAQRPDLLPKLPKGSILTPHPKEFSRLFGDNADSMIRVDNARVQAMRYGIVIVLKDHHTAVLTPDGDVWYNMTGNAGMAKGGSGDVLTGIITAFAGRGYNAVNAAIMGVYLHGLAGDFAATDLSSESILAGDIINYLSKAFLSLAV